MRNFETKKDRERAARWQAKLAEGGILGAPQPTQSDFKPSHGIPTPIWEQEEEEQPTLLDVLVTYCIVQQVIQLIVKAWQVALAWLIKQQEKMHRIICDQLIKAIVVEVNDYLTSRQERRCWEQAKAQGKKLVKLYKTPETTRRKVA